jgi:hypothetical protein
MQKIFTLHEKKEYKMESLFTAAGIFDRYVSIIGASNFDIHRVLDLSVISVLLSAKLE